MKEVHDIEVVKNLGQYLVAPLLGLILAILAIKGGGIKGYFAFIFGGLIFVGITFVILFIYDRFVVQPIAESNEKIQKAERERIRKMIEEENDPDAYPEYDD